MQDEMSKLHPRQQDKKNFNKLQSLIADMTTTIQALANADKTSGELEFDSVNGSEDSATLRTATDCVAPGDLTPVFPQQLFADPDPGNGGGASGWTSLFISIDPTNLFILF